LGGQARTLLGPSARTAWINDAIQLLQFEVRRELADFHPEPGCINLQNGILKTSNGKLVAHNPRYNSRSQLPFAYDLKAQCPRWKKFIREIFADDPTKGRTLQQWFGYCLTPEVSLQQFVILLGTGSNGKSVVLAVLGALVGKENKSAIPLD